MSDVDQTVANSATDTVTAPAEPAAPAKRSPSVILADIEAKRSQAHAAKTTADTAQGVYQNSLADLRALRAEFDDATQEVVGWFTEVADMPDDVFSWVRKHL